MSLVLTRARFFERFFLASNYFELIEGPKFININIMMKERSQLGVRILRNESTKVSTLLLPTISRFESLSKTFERLWYLVLSA